jgi:hypothetical protein
MDQFRRRRATAVRGVLGVRANAEENVVKLEQYLTSSPIVAAFLSVAVAACNSESGDTDGSGGSMSSGTGATAGVVGTTTGGSGGTPASGGSGASGGTQNGGSGGSGITTTGGTAGSGGGSGGTVSTAGGGSGGTAAGSGGTAAGSGGTAAGSGGTAAGSGGVSAQAGAGGSGGRGGRSNSGGASGAGAAAGGSGGAVTGTCTASKAVNTKVSGTGPHKVVVETNSDPGIAAGTIFRPSDLGGTEKYPIFVWGEGGCSQDGLSNSAAMAEIASHGYFVVADGTPNGTGNRTMDRSKLKEMGAPLIAYVDWAIAENGKACSAYYQSLDASKVASNGFSCGGLMSQGTVMDPRIVTWGVTSSGMAGADQTFYDMIHTPVLFVEGGTGDVAYDGGKEGYDATSKLTVPVMWFSKDLGHGGDLFTSNGGDFTKLNLAWLNWWLKGDETATGKGLLVGASCTYCSNSAWEVMSAHVP